MHLRNPQYWHALFLLLFLIHFSDVRHRHHFPCPLFICLNFSLVHFKNDPEYLSKVYILLMRFLQQSLVSRSFLVHLRYFFLIFSFISLCPMVFTSNILKFSCSSEVLFSYFFFHFCLFDDVRFQVLVIFLFSKRSDAFLMWIVSILPLFFINLAHF